MPKAVKFNLKSYEAVNPNKYEKEKRKDVLWSTLSMLQSNTPIWSGWNSKFSIDPLPLKAFGYMENIELPPTRLAMVQQIMVISQNIRKEYMEKHMIVTYDLRVAKLTMYVHSGDGEP